MKKNIRKIVSVILFLALLFFLMGRLYKIVSWKDTTGEYYSSIEQLKNTGDNLIDVVFVGTSHVYCGIYPSVMWEEHGISAFNMSVSGQDRYSAYHDMQELVKTQSPKAVFVDLYFLSFTEGIEGNVHRNMLCLPTSTNSYGLLKDYFGTEDEESRKKVKDYVLRWPVVHTRHRELGKYDYLHFEENDYFRGEKIFYETSPVSLDEIRMGSDTVGELTDDEIELLDKFVKMSEDNGFTLYFTMLPCCVDESAQQKINAAEVYAREKGIEFLDFRRGGLLELDPNTDFIDNAHLNAKGAVKLSSYLGNYASMNVELEDHRGDENYHIWDEDARYHYRSDFVNHLSTAGSLDEFAELASGSSGYTYIISREFTYDESKKDYANALELIGMAESDFAEGGTWIYKEGSLSKLFVNDSGEEVQYPLSKYDVLSLRFNGDYQQENVMIGKEDYSNKGFYLGITVYDNELERVALFKGF